MSEEDPYEFKFKKQASYDDENGDFYRDLTKVTKSFFYNKNMTNIFIAAMALGFVKDTHMQIKRPVTNIPTAVFTKEEKWLIISLYYKTHPETTVSDLYETDKILQNAEEYANGGIKFLKMIYEGGEPLEELETELRKYLE